MRVEKGGGRENLRSSKGTWLLLSQGRQRWAWRIGAGENMAATWKPERDGRSLGELQDSQGCTEKPCLTQTTDRQSPVSFVCPFHRHFPFLFKPLVWGSWRQEPQPVSQALLQVDCDCDSYSAVRMAQVMPSSAGYSACVSLR